MNTKDGGSSDDMISLIQTGEYDGVSASGNASVRLMATGEVAPIDPELLPNYADVQEGIKNQDYNSLDGEPYGVPHGRGPNYLMFRTDVVPESTDSWSVIWDEYRPYNGKLSIYDDSLFIADAALYLKATQPDLGIDNPYHAQRGAVHGRSRPAQEAGAERGRVLAGRLAKQIQSFTNGDSVVGTAWPYQSSSSPADKPSRSRRSSRRRARPGWSDTWMIYSKAATRTACTSGWTT